MQARRGDIICGRYEVRAELGTGTFGKVFRCKDAKHRDTVAIKVIRRIHKYIDSARIEARILSQVYAQQKKEKTSYIVKLFSHFTFNGYYCLVFERLGISLYDFLKKHHHDGFPMHIVREIAQQMLHGVAFLHNMHLIHTDLKLENVLLIDDEEEVITRKRDGKLITVPRRPRVKLIDFGGATYDDEKKSRCVNTRQYRGPEVTLETGWSFPSDLWSVGCMVAEIHTGELLFPTHNNLEHLCLMERILSPQRIGLAFKASSSLCRKYMHSSDGALRIEDLSSDSLRCVETTLTLSEMFEEEGAEEEERKTSHKFVSLLRGLLALDPTKRLTAKAALAHPFFASLSTCSSQSPCPPQQSMSKHLLPEIVGIQSS